LWQPAQPCLGPGPAQALLPHVQRRAPSSGDRGQHRPVFDRGPLLQTRRGAALSQERDGAAGARPGAARRADVRGALALGRQRREAGEIVAVARDLTAPSPLAQEVLTARPYAFLDDAPLEERRTQAVMSRRWLDPDEAALLGKLDADAIARVRAEAWPEAVNA